MIYKSDIVIYHEENGQGVRIAKFVSKKRARRHGIKKPPRPVNRKRAMKPKRDKKDIERSEASMAGGKKYKKLNRKTGHNWLAKQRNFARRKNDEIKNIRKQRYFRSGCYHYSVRIKNRIFG